MDSHEYAETTGVWEEDTGRIIIKRSQLKSLESFAGTLLHEVAHARCGWPDTSREFEHELTALLGLIASRVVG